MKMQKVRVGASYTFHPVLLDLIDGRTELKIGDRVQVINLPGAPSANSMGHCYVGHPKSGEFIGMVHVNSLIPAR